MYSGNLYLTVIFKKILNKILLKQNYFVLKIKIIFIISNEYMEIGNTLNRKIENILQANFSI